MYDEEEFLKMLALKRFEEDVLFLQKNIPPDDIYTFSQQTLNSCMHFIEVLTDFANLDDLAEENEETHMHLSNILALVSHQHQKKDIQLNLELKLKRK